MVGKCAKKDKYVRNSTLEMAENQISQFVLDTKFQKQPVKLSDDWCNMLALSFSSDETGGTVLNSFKTIYIFDQK